MNKQTNKNRRKTGDCKLLSFRYALCGRTTMLKMHHTHTHTNKYSISSLKIASYPSNQSGHMQANFVFEVTEWRKNKSKSTLHKGARLFKRMQTQIENDKLNGDMKYRNERERRKSDRKRRAIWFEGSSSKKIVCWKNCTFIIFDK